VGNLEHLILHLDLQLDEYLFTYDRDNPL
jgi:hypothetical protein